MSLLGKAFEFKKEMTRRRKETPADNIARHAETDFTGEDGSQAVPDGESADIAPDAGGIADISDVIYELEGDDELPVREIGAEEEDGGIVIEDDLFDLPRDDDQSPVEILKEQKGRTVREKPDSMPARAELREARVELPAEEEDENPLGPEDEPVISIDRVLEAQEEERIAVKKAPPPENIKMPEIKTPSGSESEAAPAAAAKRQLPASLPSKEKAVGAFLEEEEDDEVDEVVYSYDKFQDFSVLYEIIKDISRADTKDELYDVILFSINGQLGCSSSSVMIASHEDNTKWFVANSLGIEVQENLSFDSTEGILKNLRRNIIDIDDYKDDPECIDQFDQFLSIDTKLIAPIVFKKKMLGALILGEKITETPYTEEEFGLIASVCNASATLFNKVASIERLNNESLGLKSDLDYSIHLNDMQDTILRNASIRSLEKIVQKEFEYLWIEYFSVFLKNERDDSYVPFVVEADDSLSLKGSGFRINNKDLFIDYVRGLENGEKVEMFEKLDAVKSAFDKDLIKKMSILWIYPFKVGHELVGFITVFKIRDKILEQEIDSHLRSFTKILLSSIFSIKEVDPEEIRFIDNIEIIYKRIGVELANARQMNIPLTLIHFSIKNFKRYANLYGYKESIELINKCVDIIKSKISGGDFAARIDRNKILIVLPGKDKKFATPLANSIRNDIMRGFKNKEIQLLITFLMAEFPTDGDNLQSLMDGID